MQQVMFTVGCFCAMGLTVLTSRAQDDFAQLRLEKLFSQAIKAEDMEYVALRDEILRENEADKFLEEKAKSKNLMTRVIGRAMLSWKSDFATNMCESEKAIKTVNEMLRSRIGQNRILGDLYTAKDQPGWVKPESPVAVILLEIALKGPSLKINPEYSRVPRDGLLVRSYAAGWSGLYDDPDVVPVLLMLAKEAGDGFLRNCALIGLRNKTGDDVTEIFLSALIDQNLAIRDLAAYELRIKTGQNFGIDQAKYRAWFETKDVGKMQKP